MLLDMESVKEHIKDLSESQKNAWFMVANSAVGTGKTEDEAIKRANRITSYMEAKAHPMAGALAYNILNEASRMEDQPAEVLGQAVKIVEGMTRPETGMRISCDHGNEWVDFQEAKKDLSFEQIRDSVRTTIREKIKPLKAWVGVNETYADYVIVFIEPRNESEMKHYKYSYTIDNNGNIELKDPTEVKRVISWEPVDQNMIESGDSEMEFEGQFIPLTESKKSPIVDKNGKAKIKIISPGWGESAYYKPEILERDAKVFKGAKMFWNHQTSEEEKARPEGNLNNLAGLIENEPKYDQNGPRGAGVYGEAKIYEAYREPVEEMASDIGVSIRAGGTGKKGKIEGREGLIAEAIKYSKSVDFVTTPGAGGEILPLFEAAGTNKWKEAMKIQNNFEKGGNEMKIEDLTLEQLKESRKDLYDIIISESKPTEPQVKPEGNVELKEANRRIEILEEKIMLREAGQLINKELSSAKLPEKVKSRLLRETLANVETTEDGKLDETKLKESVKGLVTEALEEISELTESGKITGMGESNDPIDFEETKVEDLEASLVESFKGMGMTEEAAKIAAKKEIR